MLFGKEKTYLNGQVQTSGVVYFLMKNLWVLMLKKIN
jgi:hypothetical protein